MLQGRARKAMKKFLDDPNQETFDALEEFEDEIAAHLPEVGNDDPELLKDLIDCAFYNLADEDVLELLDSFADRFLSDVDSEGVGDTSPPPIAPPDPPDAKDTPKSSPGGSSVGYRPPKHPWCDPDDD